GSIQPLWREGESLGNRDNRNQHVVLKAPSAEKARRLADETRQGELHIMVSLERRHPSMEVLWTKARIKQVCAKHARDVLGTVSVFCPYLRRPAVEIASLRLFSQVLQLREGAV